MGARREAIILFHQVPMKASRKIQIVETGDTLLPEPRRSTRQHKAPKNDDFLMGTCHLEELLGNTYYEEDYHPKRRRKNHRFDDSDDYSEGHRHPRRNPQIHLNQVEALLEWKKQVTFLPITVNYHVGQEETPIEELHTIKCTKSVANQNLLSVAQDVEAIFINIDWDKPGQTLKQFQQLKIESNKVMSKGLIFVWAPKQYISQLLSIMEKKDFSYVENLEIVKLDISKAIEHAEKVTKNKFQEGKSTIYQVTDIWQIVKFLDNANPRDLIADEPSDLFNRSKQTLLMFKKVKTVLDQNNSAKFELRHQRTCDVVFDMPLNLKDKCAPDTKGYIYNMIETLLPDCLNVCQKGKASFGFKMLELWGDKNQPRRGWISMCQE